MKKTIFISLVVAAAAATLASCNKPQVTIETPAELSINVNATQAQTRAIIGGSQLPDGSNIGVFLTETDKETYDNLSYVNVKFTATGEAGSQTWGTERPVYLSTTTGGACAYYPYSNSVTDVTAVPVETASQTDYMWATPVPFLNNRNASATLTMNHGLAAVNLSLVKGTYSGAGSVTEVSVNGPQVATSATMNAKTGALSGFSGKDAKVGPAISSFTLSGTAKDNIIIVIPTGTEGKLTITAKIDGADFMVQTPAVDLAEGTITKYTLNVNSEQLEIAAVNVTPWANKDKGALDMEVFSKVDDYLTIEALEDGLTASLSVNACEYCIDGDGNWRSLAARTVTEAVNKGQTLSFRGNLNPNSSNGIGTFTVSRQFNLKGDCMSMIYGDDAKDIYSLEGKDYAFYKLFFNCTTLKNCDSNVLKATTLAGNCHQFMFYGCTNLTKAPELPATTLAEKCYFYMFNGCTELTTAPELPATTLAKDCYNGMFRGCTGLTQAPAKLPATTLAEQCYREMFFGCTELTTAPELPATTLAKFCYNSMFYDCTGLTQAPELPATTLENYCYREMFYGCTGLTAAPKLPATTLAEYCYANMFYNCTGLNYIKMLATDKSAPGCLEYWVSGVAASGTFVRHPNMNSLPSGASGIPSGWTVQDAQL